MRRQIHIQSEQRRRAQIKDGFEDLRKLLPACNANQKISKAMILSKAVVYIEQLRTSHVALVNELQRLQGENEQMRTVYENIRLRRSLAAAAKGDEENWL